ncbi:MAG TPA: LysO family transporter [Thermaerobacter sp.]
MTAILLALLAGAAAGAAGWDRVLPGRVWDGLSRVALLALLGVMGLRLGTDPGVAAAAAPLGVRATLFAVATAGGALLAGWLGSAIFAPLAPGTAVLPEPATAAREPGLAGGPREPGLPMGSGEPRPAPVAGEPGHAAGTREAFRMGLLAAAAVGAGFVLGRTAMAATAAAGGAAPGASGNSGDPGGAGLASGIGGAAEFLEPAATALLLALLALYGREFGRQWRPVRAFILSARWRLLLVPLAGGLGTLAGGLAAGWLTGTPPREALAAAAAFGWYSLAGVLVDRLAGPAAGALAFLANVLRELLAVLAIPLLAPRLGRARRWLLVLPGGATTMDTTLPVIAAATDVPTTALAFLHGLALSLLAPPLILWLAG